MSEVRFKLNERVWGAVLKMLFSVWMSGISGYLYFYDLQSFTEALMYFPLFLFSLIMGFGSFLYFMNLLDWFRDYRKGV